MATDRTPRRTALALAALAALTVTVGACSMAAATNAAGPSAATNPTVDGDAVLGAPRPRGGWDGNSNEPLLADDFG